jgi:hypothetical protein
LGAAQSESAAQLTRSHTLPLHAKLVGQPGDDAAHAGGPHKPPEHVSPSAQSASPWQPGAQKLPQHTLSQSAGRHFGLGPRPAQSASVVQSLPQCGTGCPGATHTLPWLSTQLALVAQQIPAGQLGCGHGDRGSPTGRQRVNAGISQPQN